MTSLALKLVKRTKPIPLGSFLAKEDAGTFLKLEGHKLKPLSNSEIIQLLKKGFTDHTLDHHFPPAAQNSVDDFLRLEKAIQFYQEDKPLGALDHEMIARGAPIFREIMSCFAYQAMQNQRLSQREIVTLTKGDDHKMQVASTSSLPESASARDAVDRSRAWEAALRLMAKQYESVLGIAANQNQR